MRPLPPARVEPLLSALTALRDDLVDWSKGLG